MIFGPHCGHEADNWWVEDEELVGREPYIVLQWIDGRSLQDMVPARLTRNREWERRVIRFGLQLTTILGELHRRRSHNSGDYYFIYQDLKPSNVIVSHEDFIALIDFGAVTMVAREGEGEFCSHWQGAGAAGAGTDGYRAA